MKLIYSLSSAFLLLILTSSDLIALPKKRERVPAKYYTPLGARTYSVNPTFPKMGWPFSERGEKVPSTLVPNFFRPFRVLIDPGHGGHDKGAVGVNGTLEKDLCLKLSKMIRQRLERRARLMGISLVAKLTRATDVFIPLRARVDRANRWEADLFVSVHANAAPSSKPKGFEVYFLSTEASDDHTRYVVAKENAEGRVIEPGILSILSDIQRTRHIDESGEFARKLYSVMGRTLRPNVRGVRQGPFTVLNGTQMPAVLVEVGYLTNPNDAKMLRRQDYLNRVVSAISSGILKHVIKMRRLG